MSKTEERPATDTASSSLTVTAIELIECSVPKNRYSRIRLAFDSWLTRTGQLTSRVTYTRRYDLNAEFDSESNYFQIPDTVVNGCREFIKKYKLLEDHPPKKGGRRPLSYSEIRVYSGKKTVARVLKKGACTGEEIKDDTDKMFDELSRLLQRTLG